MIVSMTGFGRGTATRDGFQVTVEIKTVNSRYLDISSKLPNMISDKELELKEMVQEAVQRGKVSLTTYLDRSETGNPSVTFSPKLAKSYGRMLEEIRAAAGITEPVTLKDLTAFNDIFIRRQEDEETVEAAWKLTKSAAEEALKTLNAMRKNEGGQLKKELASQIHQIEGQLSSIMEMSKNRGPETMKRYRNRIAELLDEIPADSERLEQEIAILVDKMDIQEEVIRLQSHLKFFLEALESNEPVGRRLNFLCQEINRELNTIGSKANETDISHLVVQSKEHLEQIREQVQNIQ
ncbi:MAG: YicC/YloC family endoribonuclease [Balneolaceae bacterium]